MCFSIQFFFKEDIARDVQFQELVNISYIIICSQNDELNDVFFVWLREPVFCSQIGFKVSSTMLELCENCGEVVWALPKHCNSPWKS